MAGHSSASHRRWLKRGFAIVLVSVGLWIAGLFIFVNMLPRSAPQDDTKTDAIVVLTGGSYRLEEGLSLLAEDRAKKLFVSGVYRGVDVAKIIELSRQKSENFECCVVLGYSASSTAGNALETVEWITKQGYQSIRLVTADYHMPRSLLEIRKRMPGVSIIPHAVFPRGFSRDRWWAVPGSLKLVLSEYSKYLVSWVRQLGEGDIGKTARQ
ncbi:MAG: YdcF family protein [Proteobacteria bacterium]|nr:YdcF family protein [Pseudomonadota bacterium]